MEKRIALVGAFLFFGAILRRLLVGDVLTAVIIVLVVLALGGLYAVLWHYMRRLLVNGD